MSLVAKPVPSRIDATLAALLIGALILGCALLALVIGLKAGRSPSGEAVAIAVAALPLLLFIARRRPIGVLFGLYIIMVPIDDALNLGHALSLTKLLGMAAAIAAVALLLRRPAQIRLPYAVLGWAAVIALMALSTIWGINPKDSGPVLVEILSAFALLVTLVAAPLDAADLRAIIVATIASGVVVGCVAIVMSHNELSTIAGRTGRLFLNFGATTADPNRFGAALLLPVAMTVGAICQARGWLRLGLLAILPFPFAAIYLTASRGTTLGLIAMAIVAIIRSKHRLALFALLAVCVGLMLLIPNEITQRFFASGSTASGAGRLDVWSVGVAIFRNHWLIGTGVGTFPSAYDRAFFSGYESQFAGWGRAPHSLLVSTVTELGVVGLLVMVFAFVLQYRSLRLITEVHPYPWLRTVFASAFVGVLIASLFVDVQTTKFAWLLFTEMLVAARLGAAPLVRDARRMPLVA